MIGPDIETLTMLQQIVFTMSIVVGLVTIGGTIVYVTRHIVKGATEASTHIGNLTTSVDRLSTVMSKGFEDVRVQITDLRVDQHRLATRVTIVEQHSGLKTPIE